MKRVYLCTSSVFSDAQKKEIYRVLMKDFFFYVHGAEEEGANCHQGHETYRGNHQGSCEICPVCDWAPKCLKDTDF